MTTHNHENLPTDDLNECMDKLLVSIDDGSSSVQRRFVTSFYWSVLKRCLAYKWTHRPRLTFAAKATILFILIGAVLFACSIVVVPALLSDYVVAASLVSRLLIYLSVACAGGAAMSAFGVSVRGFVE